MSPLAICWPQTKLKASPSVVRPIGSLRVGFTDIFVVNLSFAAFEEGDTAFEERRHGVGDHDFCSGGCWLVKC